MLQTGRRISALILAAALLLALCGCGFLPQGTSKDVSAHARSFFAMDTEMSLRLYGDADESGLDAMQAMLLSLEAALSATDPSSALSLLNRQGRTEDPTLCTLISRSMELHLRTGGALDISLYPASLAWGFTTDRHQIPGQEALQALRELTGMEKLTIRADAVELPRGMQLDLGAVAKGWAADRCRAIAEEKGLCGILSLGGSIQTVGQKPDGSAWVIGIQDPDDPGAFLLTLTLEGSRAVVTSGDYQRYFEEDGVRYCHILDPETLSPVQNSLRAVTVVAAEGFLADGLSTALFVLGRQKGLELYRASGDFEAIWVEKDGTVTLTPGLKDLASGRAFEVAGQ